MRTIRVYFCLNLFEIFSKEKRQYRSRFLVCIEIRVIQISKVQKGIFFLFKGMKIAKKRVKNNKNLNRVMFIGEKKV